MATLVVDVPRDVVPRLRDFRTTAALGELDEDHVQAPIVTPQLFSGLEAKILAWKTNGGVGQAADLVNNAFLLKQSGPSVLEAAAFLRTKESALSGPLLEVVRGVLDGGTDNWQVIHTQAISEEWLQKKIHKIRGYLREQPRNSVLNVELSRLYILLNQPVQSKKSMLQAVKLSPNNRFVLRSASRLFLHLKERGLAHDVLRYADRTRFDSWLLAAEISVASAIGHRPRFLSQGQRLLKEHKLGPGDISELATAVAMEEIEHGKNRTAKQLIQLAIEEPTENTLAQVAWASRNRIHLGNLDANRFKDVPLLHESMAWQFFEEQNWSRAKEEAMLWYEDQPFSSRPVNFAGYVACTLERNYRDSIRIYEVGRRVNPTSFTILNNLAFAYASDNQPDKADEILNSFPTGILDEKEKVYAHATSGLIAFRRGQIAIGRALYKAAITNANKTTEKNLGVRAGIYYAREELRLNPPDAIQIRQQIIELVSKTSDEELKLIAQNQLPSEVELQSSASRIPKTK